MLKTNSRLLLGLLSFSLFSSFFSITTAVAREAEKPLVIIDDEALLKDFEKKLGALAEAKKLTPCIELVEQLARTSVEVELPDMRTTVLKDIYSSQVGSVGIIASVFKCTKCPNWHSSSVAVCWPLTEDGIMVTNYHVFDGRKHVGFGVLTQDGRMTHVVEVLAADKDKDIAIFRVAAKGYTPIPLGKAQKVGGNVHIISHPEGRFFTYSSGQVTRYYKDKQKKKAYWMGVTAEYAHGSSGGPVMDDAGNVIGMVSSTNAVFYPMRNNPYNKNGILQMVIRNTVPVDAIRKLITKPETKSK